MKKYTITIDEKLMNEFKEWCKDNDITISEAVEEFIVEVLKINDEE